jgi:hypothetical protein
MDSQKNKKGTSVIEMEPSWNLLYYFGFQNFALAANLRDTIWGHVNPNVHKAAVYANPQLFEGAVFVLHDRLFEIAGENSGTKRLR